MSTEKTRFLSYICPRCRQSVIVERDVFALAAAPVHIKCPCGKSELSVEFMPQRVRLSVPCVYCGREHLVSCPSHAFLRERALAFSCTASGLDCCYVGEEGPVYAATARLEQAVDKLDQDPGPEEERPPLPGSHGDGGGPVRAAGHRRPGRSLLRLWVQSMDLPGELQLGGSGVRPVRRGDAHSSRHRG